MKRSVGVLLGIATAAGALAGCELGHACNLMLPLCALRIDLAHEAWEPGSYSFRFSLDGEHAHCDVELFADPATLPEVDCSNPELASVTPFAFHDLQRTPEALYAYGSPREAHVIVEREGVEIASGSFHPRYEVSEPNGEGCGDCENATETLAF